MEKRIAVVMGTRPEGIKLCPLVLKMRSAGLPAVVLASGQHEEMLGEALSAFSVQADISLSLKREGEDLFSLVTELLRSVGACLRRLSPALVIVQGDTATAYAAALSAFLLHIPVMHVEAGLRSGHLFSPFPEESLRRSIAAMASLHIAPTPQAVRHLWEEGIPKKSIYLFGNTVEDALLRFLPSQREESGPMVLTVHRREHSEKELCGIFSAVEKILELHANLSLLYPVHPSPRVRAIAEKMLSGKPRIRLAPPMPVSAFYRALAAAPLVMTDSGGVQEEAAALGVRTLVLRENTERESELQSGRICLGGIDPQGIISRANAMLSVPPPKRKESRNGSPSDKICKLLCSIISNGFDMQRLFREF